MKPPDQKWEKLHELTHTLYGPWSEEHSVHFHRLLHDEEETWFGPTPKREHLMIKELLGWFDPQPVGYPGVILIQN